MNEDYYKEYLEDLRIYLRGVLSTAGYLFLHSQRREPYIYDWLVIEKRTRLNEYIALVNETYERLNEIAEKYPNPPQEPFEVPQGTPSIDDFYKGEKWFVKR